MNRPFDLTGCFILVTGASSGIGRAAAICLSRLGARLCLVGRDEKRLHETRGLLAGEGHRCESFDLSSTGAIAEWLRGIAVENGALDGLVHAAGVFELVPLKAVSPDIWEKVWRINVSSSVFLLKAFRQRDVRAEKSGVVLISSVAAVAGGAGLTVYGGTKGAIISLVKSAAVEFARDSIRVNCVVPGFVTSEMTRKFLDSLMPDQLAAIEKEYPLGFGTPEDVASAIAFLVSPAASWISGSSLVVDGGRTAH